MWKKERATTISQKVQAKVVTRSPYNLKKQSQDDMNTHSLRTSLDSLESEGICKNQKVLESPDCNEHCRETNN